MGKDRSGEATQSGGEVSPPTPRHQFYGRRKGKPLRRQHSDLMQNMLPAIALDITQPLHGTGDRRWLEIGFGGGEHLAHQAGLNPHISLLGAEAFLNGVAKLLAHLDESKVQNVRVLHGDARDLLEVLPDACLERLYLLYPDPWPKERQKKRRFVNPVNLAHFYRLLQPQGLFLFASDIPDYVEWTKQQVMQHAGFSLQGDPTQPFENWIRTRYEAKAVREGRDPAYLRFRKL